jgi:hypothetical protein
VLDARRPVDTIRDDLRRQAEFLSNSDIAVEGLEAAR